MISWLKEQFNKTPEEIRELIRVTMEYKK